MQFRESGMPPKDYWESLFNVPLILDQFGFGPETGDVAELGCGYGTFSVPLAQRIRESVYAIDTDPRMVAATRVRAVQAGLSNLHVRLGDVLVNGFGCLPGSCDACLLFNILHCETPVEVLRAARHVVRPGGLIAAIHWRTDVPTPRGPSLAVRPSAGQIAGWAATAELQVEGTEFLLPPWHFGLRLHRAS